MADLERDFPSLKFDRPDPGVLCITLEGPGLNAVDQRMTLANVPIAARPRVGRSHIRIVRDGVRFLLIILRIATIFSPLKVFLPMSAALLFVGLGRWGWTYIAERGRFTGGAQLAIVTAVILFALALISEQVAALRFDRSEREH